MGEGFAYRTWRLYFAPTVIFQYGMGCNPDEREKFIRAVWASGKYRSKQ